MLLLASLHVHQPSASASADCYACLHHIHHDGHIASTSLTIDSCLLCHFLTTPYVAATVVAVVFAVAFVLRTRNRHSVSIVATVHDAKRLRAPPVCL